MIALVTKISLPKLLTLTNRIRRYHLLRNRLPTKLPTLINCLPTWLREGRVLGEGRVWGKEIIGEGGWLG